MIIILTGGTGLIGRALGQKLSSKNYKIHLLARKEPKNIYPCTVFLWPDVHSSLPKEAFPEGEDYGVIHLAGEPVSRWPWTKKTKEKIHSSRVEGTKKLISHLKSLKQAPCFFLSASAIGIYGEQGEKQVTEADSISSQKLFLQKVCKDWEEEALKAKEICRTVISRLGIVMSYEQGFLQQQAQWIKKRLCPFILSRKTCWLSWIALEDLVRMILWAVENEQVQGIYNAVSPKPVSLKEFYSTLAEQMKTKCLPLPSPLFLMRRIGGEMTKNLLVSCKALPEKALKQSFTFKKAELKQALKRS